MTTYNGSCHCGAVRYEATIDLQRPVISCNCTLCGRTGSLLAFIPVGVFRLLAGYGSLTHYLVNKHVIHLLFCKVCGIKSFARGKRPDGMPMIAVNARCLEGVDVATLNVKPYEGKSR